MVVGADALSGHPIVHAITGERTVSCLRNAATLLAASLCWGVPVDADAGWRARAEALQAEAAEVQEQRQSGQQALESESPVSVGQVPSPRPRTLVAREAIEAGEGLQVPGYAPLVLSDDQIEGARDAGVVNEDQLRWLRPRASALPPNPHATTDFTAYTLQPGELKIGLAGVGVGVLPNIQATTIPALLYTGLPNFNFKVNALRAGPLNLAVTGSRTWLNQESFRSAHTGAGAVASLRIVPAWSVHGGVSWAGLSAKGVPDLCALSPLLTDGANLEGVCQQVSASDPQPVTTSGSSFGFEGNDLFGEIMWVRAATDIRLNRRDSIILQASAVPYARVQLADEVEVPEIALLNEVLAYDGRVPLDTMYMVSAAYQVAWKNVHLRVGVGTSSLPLAWLTQTTELSVHFGGKDNRQRSKQQRTWRRNRRHLGRGLDGVEG